MSKKSIIYNWMDCNYDGTFKSIRAVWYRMKPTVQTVVSTTTANRLIGDWLWEQFVNGNRGVYGLIGNSQRVSVRELPIILFCEKNTLSPFEFADGIYAIEYSSSGQANSYEIANIINSLGYIDEIYLYGATDFDKAGTDIYNSLAQKLSMFYTVHTSKLEVNINDYETYIQPNGDVGLELDAIDNLEELVSTDLQEFLPYELFKAVSIRDRKQYEYSSLHSNDDVIKELQEAIEIREDELWTVVSNYNYDYCLIADLPLLTNRVKVK